MLLFLSFVLLYRHPDLRISRAVLYISFAALITTSALLALTGADLSVRTPNTAEEMSAATMAGIAFHL